MPPPNAGLRGPVPPWAIGAAAARAAAPPQRGFGRAVAACVALGLLAGGAHGQAVERRYEACLVDGTRMEADYIVGFENPGAPLRLNGLAIDDRQPHRLRWICDRSAPVFDAARHTGGYVEFHNGDRLPGSFIGCRPAERSRWGAAPATARVRVGDRWVDPVPRQGDAIEVWADEVRRIVAADVVPRARYHPGQAIARDGRTISFRDFRWAANAIELLSQDAVVSLRVEDLAELHLPPADPWQTYYRELAALDPAGEGTLLRYETADGLVLTTSVARLRSAASHLTRGICHVVQPAWSPMAVWIPARQIRLQARFLAHELPLSRLPPLDTRESPTLGQAWSWRVDRSVAGGKLHSGGQLFAWGLGVHGDSRLRFAFPPLARSFRTRLGLDHTVGDGGCARGVVGLASKPDTPLFRSKQFVGSGESQESGELALGSPSPPGEALILSTDPEIAARPPGADPLDVRDHLDWLEPMLLLDAGLLRGEVAQRLARQIPAWDGWALSGDAAAGPPLETAWHEGDRRYAANVLGSRGWQLTRELALGPDDRWLYLDFQQVQNSSAPGRLDLRINERLVASLPAPPSHAAQPVTLSLAGWSGQRARFDLQYVPADPPGLAPERLRWRTLAIVDAPTRARWSPLEIASAVSQSGVELALQPDGSLLAQGMPKRVNRGCDTYLLHAAPPRAPLTGLRLEALTDPSLLNGGPGRDGGNFVLSELLVAPRARPRPPLAGRFLRIEIPAAQRVLALAEVQVFGPPLAEAELAERLRAGPALPEECGNPDRLRALLARPAAERTAVEQLAVDAACEAAAENLAHGRAARQSSSQAAYPAGLAVDGQVGGGFSHTQEQNEPWWEVDLGDMRTIDRIVVWNRIDFGVVHRLAGFQAKLLDAVREPVWQRGPISSPPTPAVELDGGDGGVAFFSSASASRSDGASPRPLDTQTGRWQPTIDLGRPQVAVYTFREPLQADAGLRIELRFPEERSLRTLGRFRVLATSDPPPHDVEPIPLELPAAP